MDRILIKSVFIRSERSLKHKLTSRDDYTVSLATACALFGKALKSLK